jgi:hypothetical protein
MAGEGGAKSAVADGQPLARMSDVRDAVLDERAAHWRSSLGARSM